MNFLPLDEHQQIGLYQGNQFKLINQADDCKDCQTVPQALWYFKNETVLVAADAAKIAGFDAKKPAMQDIENAKTISQDNSVPPLVWVGSRNVITNTQISKNTENADLEYAIKDDKLDYKQWLGIESKIATNLSFWDDSTTAFFKDKSVWMRGEMTSRGFIAQTVWPHDFSLDLHAKPKPLAANETLRDLVMFENGGAKSAFESRKLWQRTAHDIPTSLVHPHAEKPVLAMILNGAQGDDDEAHGGHFAIATGRIGSSGDMNNWLVNNYYNLASNSEKGIIAAPTLLDNYFADINSGQSYYRPSYMLVAVFKQDTVPARFQAATNRVYNHFYRNNIVYDHSRQNCAGISIDTLHELGWSVPERGVTSQLKATGAYFYVGATEQSLSEGRAAYDYLSTETTRLFPAVTFDAIGENLLFGVNQWSRNLYVDHNPVSPYMRQIAEDVEAIYFVRIPQIPSSRAFGQAPVYGFDEYMAQAPADRSQWKVVPTTPNPLPDNLKNGLALKLEKPSVVPWPVAIVLALFIGGFVWAVRKLRKKLFG